MKKPFTVSLAATTLINLITGTFPWRGITKDTMEFFGVETRLEGNEAVSVHFPYGKATKVRKVKEKDFLFTGDAR